MICSSCYVEFPNGNALAVHVAAKHTPSDVRGDPPEQGRKDDKGKVLWNLIPWSAVRQIAGVLTYGAQKYAPDNWRYVPDARARYFAAAMRHLTAWWEGEKLDPESGKHHLAHVACCVLFLLALDHT